VTDPRREYRGWKFATRACRGSVGVIEEHPSHDN
jgi:hypothetical protein